MLTLSEIAAIVGSPVPPGSERLAIEGVETLTEAGPAHLSFLGSDAFLKQFAATKAAAVVVHKRVKVPADARAPVLVVDDADLAIARVLERFGPPGPRP